MCLSRLGAVSNSQAIKSPGEPVRQARELSEGVWAETFLSNTEDGSPELTFSRECQKSGKVQYNNAGTWEDVNQCKWDMEKDI